MRKLHLIFFLFSGLVSINGQNDDNIVIGKIDSIHSKILNAKRELWIHVPFGYDHDVSKTKKYPVLYLLDGNAHFYSVVGMIKQLSSVNGNTLLPKMIIVGIPNTNRIRDLSPNKIALNPPYSNPNMVANSGGGDKFISFIEKELIPYIDSKYATVSFRTFVGHSLGGLTVMNTLIYKPELFNGYVAIDPSMWWHNENLLNKIKQVELDDRFKNKSLFLGFANTMSKDMDTVKVQKDTTYATRHIRAIIKLNALLNKDKLNNLSFQGKYYPEDTHGSVPLIATYDALRYIFNFYDIKIGKHDLVDSKIDLFGKVKTHYSRLSMEFGRDIKPEQFFIANLAFELIGLKEYEKAEQFLKLNASNYPESFSVFNDLGEFYATQGNKKKAIENFEKSYALNGNSFSVEQLEKLKRN